MFVSVENLIEDDISLYPEILDGWYDQSQVAHFPKEIPVDSQDVRMFYFPGYMQASKVLQLELKLSEIQMTNLLIEYRDVTRTDYSPCFYLYEPHICHYLGRSFKFITLGAEPQGDGEFEWNHGIQYGVAISEEESKVIYWIEDW